jgi:hypothetical protein
MDDHPSKRDVGVDRDGIDIGGPRPLRMLRHVIIPVFGGCWQGDVWSQAGL